jgi:O-antigen ligase
VISGLIFLCVYLAGLALAVFRHPRFGLYTYVAVFYLHPPSRWWGALLPDLRWSLLAAAITLIATLRLREPDAPSPRPPWHANRAAKILIAFTVWLWIQNIWALDPQMQLEISVLYTKYVVLFYLIYRLVRTPEEFLHFGLAHIVGCLYFGWLAFNMTVSGRLEGVGGPGVDEANALAMHLGTAVMMGAMLILAERKWRMWICLAAMPFILNTIVLAGSRGAFLALLVGGCMLWYLKPPAHRRLFYAYATLGVVLMLSLAHDTFWDRMGTMKAAVNEEQEMDTSAESRLVLVKAQWEMAKEHPLGAGHRGTEVLSPIYIEEKYMSQTATGEVGRRSSHNTFMSALVEQGVIGAILFLMLWAWVFRTLRRLKRHVGWSPEMVARIAGVGGALTVVLIAGVFVDYLKAEVQIWLFALLASAAGLAQSETRAAPSAASGPQEAKPPVRAYAQRSVVQADFKPARGARANRTRGAIS